MFLIKINKYLQEKQLLNFKCYKLGETNKIGALQLTEIVWLYEVHKSN